VLDLAGDGIATMSISAGVRFDLFGDGAAVHTGWVGKGDALLALDRNGDGVINDGGELFGTATLLAGGARAADGFAALAALDSNGDGRVDADDTGFGALVGWVDANADGVSQAGELQSLAALGLAGIDVAAQAVSVKNSGNWIGLDGGFTRSDGSSGHVVDVWFTANRHENSLQENVSALSQAIAAYDAGDAAGAQALPGMDIGAPGTLVDQVAQLAVALQQFHGIGETPGALSAPGMAKRELIEVAEGILAVPKT
jgi:trimeric autotransporter adhesin